MDISDKIIIKKHNWTPENMLFLFLYKLCFPEAFFYDSDHDKFEQFEEGWRNNHSWSKFPKKEKCIDCWRNAWGTGGVVRWIR